MKIYAKLSIIAIFGLITLTSCDDTNTTTDSTSNRSEVENNDNDITETTDPTPNEEEVLAPEGTAVDGDHSLDNMCLEEVSSDCYIVDHFIEMDVEYITVDFIDYKLDEDSKHTDYEIYDVVNDNKQLRTFIVNATYKNCGRNKDVPMQNLIQEFKDNSKTIYKLEAVDGIVSELFIDTCSG